MIYTIYTAPKTLKDKCNSQEATSSLMDEKSSIYDLDPWPVVVNGGMVAVGCQIRTVEQWRTTTKRRVLSMGRGVAMRFYPLLLDVLDKHFGVGERPDWMEE